MKETTTRLGSCQAVEILLLLQINKQTNKQAYWELRNTIKHGIRDTTTGEEHKYIAKQITKKQKHQNIKLSNYEYFDLRGNM